jgi:hypothetical protein
MSTLIHNDFFPSIETILVTAKSRHDAGESWITGTSAGSSDGVPTGKRH